MSWINELTAGVKEAISRDGKVKCAVHSEAQRVLAERVVSRMMPTKVRDITFVVIPEGEQTQYPVGCILVS